MTENRDDDHSTVVPRVMRLTSLFQLLWHAVVTHRVWFLFRDDDATFPRVPLLSTPSFLVLSPAWRNGVAMVYVSSLVVQLVSTLLSLSLSFVSGKKARRAGSLLSNHSSFFLKATTVGLFLIHACGDVRQVQSPVLHGLALLLVGDVGSMTAARIVLSGTWLWAGLHKVNPRFLSQPSHLTDPVFSLVMGADFVNEHRVGLGLMAALAEAGAGLVLLLAALLRSAPNHSSWLMRFAVRISSLFLVSVHSIIVIRLVQIQWNLSVIGWNINCGLLVVLLWHRQRRRQETRSNHYSSSAAIANVIVFALFVLLPVLVTMDRLDPYIGSALYTDNIPVLELELPAFGAAADLAAHDTNARLETLYQQWGLIRVEEYHHRAPLVPALTHTGRSIYRTDYFSMQLQATGGASVGYPSVWVYRRFVAALCQQLEDAVSGLDTNSNTTDLAGEAYFYLQLPYTGKSLVESVWAMMKVQFNHTTSDERPPPPPPKLWRKGCSIKDDDDDAAESSVVWKPMHPPLLRELDNGYVHADLARTALFSMVARNTTTTTNMAEEEEVVDIYWVDARGVSAVAGQVDNKNEDGAIDSKQQAQMVRQGSIPVGGATEQVIRVNTFVGHFFVAASTTRRDEGNINSEDTNNEDEEERRCALAVWVITESEDSVQHFVLEPYSTTRSCGQALPRTIPGWLKPCSSSHFGSPSGDEEESLNCDATSEEEPAVPTNVADSTTRDEL
jgi:hypothetical protein